MSGSNEGLGWLPVEAREDLAEQRQRASAEQAEKLIAWDPRARVLALLDRLACRSAEDADCPRLHPADLQRVIESFPGETAVDAEALATNYPGLVEERQGRTDPHPDPPPQAGEGEVALSFRLVPLQQRRVDLLRAGG